MNKKLSEYMAEYEQAQKESQKAEQAGDERKKAKADADMEGKKFPRAACMIEIVQINVLCRKYVLEFIAYIRNFRNRQRKTLKIYFGNFQTGVFP